MLKKILVFYLLIIATTSVHAVNYRNELPNPSQKSYYKGEQPTQHKPSTPSKPPVTDFPCKTTVFIPGPYVGLNPGLLTNYNRTSSVYKALEGTLFVGYAMLDSNFYLAAEIFVQHSATLQNYRNDLNNNLNPIGLKTGLGGGLSILPGFILADTLLGYLRIGALGTHFNDIAQTAAGGQVGLGLQAIVSDSWDLRAEYSYTFYQSLSNLGSPRSDAFRLGLLYKFWG